MRVPSPGLVDFGFLEAVTLHGAWRLPFEAILVSFLRLDACTYAINHQSLAMVSIIFLAGNRTIRPQRPAPVFGGWRFDGQAGAIQAAFAARITTPVFPPVSASTDQHRHSNVFDAAANFTDVALPRARLDARIFKLGAERLGPDRGARKSVDKASNTQTPCPTFGHPRRFIHESDLHSLPARCSTDARIRSSTVERSWRG